MSDSFGSGLGFGNAGPASMPAYAPTDGSVPPTDGSVPPADGSVPPADGSVPPAVDAAPMPVNPPPSGAAPPPAAPPQSALSTFGGMLKSILPGPNYAAPDPQMAPLDQASDLLQQRVKRANQIATSPLAQLFAPAQVQAARAFVPQAAEQLQKIQQQQATIQAGRVQAQTLGLAPGEISDQASQADRLTIASAKAIKGDMRAFQGIQAVDPTTAASIAPQVYEAVSGHLNNAQLAFDSLAGMQNQGQYQAKLNELRQDGTLTDLEALGAKVPATFDEFNNTKSAEGLALRNARIGIESVRQKLEDRNTYQPMGKDEAATYSGRLTTAYGDQITNGTWSRNAAAGTRGFINNGLATPDALGKGGTLGNADQRKEIGDEFKTALPPKDMEKYRAFNRIYQVATTAPRDGVYDNGKGGTVRLKQGDPMPEGTFNTNPNIQQGVTEGLASMLRGGMGGANVGLLKIETSKRAALQTALDTIKSNYSGAINTITGADVGKSYLTGKTQQQVRDIMDALKAWNDSNVSDRATGIAKRAGALGFDASALGLGNDESNGVIDSAIEEGRQAQIARMRPNFQAIGGGDGVLQLSAQVPGTGATAMPAGTTPAAQLPGAQPLMTPVQQARQPSPAANPPGPAGGAPAPLVPPGGAGQPVTVAGQQVSFNLPPGASPAYVNSLQRIESGNERDPWTAGAKGTSATGAFQAVKKTWDENKPAGAPARAADATPQQQADFLSTLTAKNATALRGSGMPVNDTTLYMAHNLGAQGAVALLHTDQNADARTAVGETVARNNPLFFRGRPTVATVLQRYQDEVAKGGGAAPQTAAAPLTMMQREAAARRGTATAAPVAPPNAADQWAQTGQDWRDTGTQAIEHAPAIASTVGAVAGGLAAGPPGAIAGGAVGGGGGQVLKDYLQGNKQRPIEIAKQTALGGVLGVASEARPVAAMATRVIGSGAVAAGASAAQNNENADIADAAGTGLAYGLGGEALGRFISSAGATAFKALSRYTIPAQQELSAHAGALSEARQTLATEKPDLPGEAGPNPKYVAAKEAATEAEKAIKDHGQNPDDMVHAYEQAKAGVSAGEAAVMRPAVRERTAVSAGYNDLRAQVNEAGTIGGPLPVGAKVTQTSLEDRYVQNQDGTYSPAPRITIKANQPLPNGPVAQLRTADNPTGKVEAKFAPDAQNAEMLMKAPAKDWGEKWQQLQNAGSELIQKRMAFLQAGDKPSATAMDNLFQGVRAQQEAAASYVFGPKQGAAVISKLENLDQRYAKVMNATAGMDYSKMQSVLASGNTPESRALEQNFKEFAKGDPTAIRAFNAMKAGAGGDWQSEAKLMIPIIAGEAAANMGGVPTVGAVSALVGGHRLYRLMQGYMNARVLGRAVKFGDFIVEEARHGTAPGIVGGAAQRGVVMQQ